jgi:hypothetical protein
VDVTADGGNAGRFGHEGVDDFHDHSLARLRSLCMPPARHRDFPENP